MLNQNNQERRVSLGAEVPEGQARDLLRVEAGTAFGGIEDAALKFTKVDNFTSFNAEYTYTGEDLVLHFFLPPERRLPEARTYWLETFPACLDVAAREFFRADYPRLMAKYTEEFESWWFKAHGYGHVIDPDAFAAKFLKGLDARVDAALSPRPPAPSSG
jgi:hypothetical protein